MRRLVIVLLLTAVVFISLTLLTASVETPRDGHDTYGFPLTFFIRFSGMCFACPPNPTETYYWKLIADILFAGLISITGVTVFIKLRQHRK